MFKKKIPLKDAKELVKQAYETGLRVGFDNGRLYERNLQKNKGSILSPIDREIEEILRKKGL